MTVVENNSARVWGQVGYDTGPYQHPSFCERVQRLASCRQSVVPLLWCSEVFLSGSRCRVVHHTSCHCITLYAPCRPPHLPPSRQPKVYGRQDGWNGLTMIRDPCMESRPDTPPPGECSEPVFPKGFTSTSKGEGSRSFQERL